MSWSHLAVVIGFLDAGALAALVMGHDIRNSWPRIVAALKMER